MITIGSFSYKMLQMHPNAKNSEILQLVKQEFPNAKTTTNCIAWYRNKLKNGSVVLQPLQVETKRTSQDVMNDIKVLEDELHQKVKEEKEENERNKEQMLQQFEMLKQKLGL